MFNKKKIICDNQGILMVEALIAMSIFAIGILAVASLLINANRSLRGASENTTASILAENQMETLLAMSYPALAGHAGDAVKEKDVGNFNVAWAIITNPPAFAGLGQQNVMLITVKTTWKSMNSIYNKEKSTSLSFIRSNMPY